MGKRKRGISKGVIIGGIAVAGLIYWNKLRNINKNLGKGDIEESEMIKPKSSSSRQKFAVKEVKAIKIPRRVKPKSSSSTPRYAVKPIQPIKTPVLVPIKQQPKITAPTLQIVQKSKFSML